MVVAEQSRGHYDALVIAAHPDDAEVRMGGAIALLSDAGRQVLLVDLVTGEPTEFAEPGVRARQAAQAATILGAEWPRVRLPRRRCSWRGWASGSTGTGHSRSRMMPRAGRPHDDDTA